MNSCICIIALGRRADAGRRRPPETRSPARDDRRVASAASAAARGGPMPATEGPRPTARGSSADQEISYPNADKNNNHNRNTNTNKQTNQSTNETTISYPSADRIKARVREQALTKSCDMPAFEGSSRLV